MKVVFLDVDGVLNSESDYVNPDGKTKKTAPRLHTNSGYVYNGISQRRVARLAKIVGDTGAKVVLTSSWKPYYILYREGRDDDHIGKYLVNALSRKKVRIFDTTAKCEGSSSLRGRGILTWIGRWNKDHPDDPVESIAILDDEWFDYDRIGLIPYLVKTDYDGPEGYSGLQDLHVEKAISLLNENKYIANEPNKD